MRRRDVYGRSESVLERHLAPKIKSILISEDSGAPDCVRHTRTTSVNLSDSQFQNSKVYIRFPMTLAMA